MKIDTKADKEAIEKRNVRLNFYKRKEVEVNIGQELHLFSTQLDHPAMLHA